MSTPLFYILAPFGMAFILFALFLIVSIIIRDPARPFRMFGAPPLDDGEEKMQGVEEDEDPEEEDPGSGAQDANKQ